MEHSHRGPMTGKTVVVTGESADQVLQPPASLAHRQRGQIPAGKREQIEVQQRSRTLCGGAGDISPGRAETSLKRAEV